MTLKHKLIIMRYRLNGFITTRILRMRPAELITRGICESELGTHFLDTYFSTGEAHVIADFTDASNNLFNFELRIVEIGDEEVCE